MCPCGGGLDSGQDVSDDAPVEVLRDPEELRPRQEVVEVVLHLVVLGEAPEVALLHLDEVVDHRRADVHHLYVLQNY